MSRHTPSHRFFDVTKALGIENLRLHDLRHAVKTYMRSMGVPADIADRVQGQVSGLKRGVGWRYDPMNIWTKSGVRLSYGSGDCWQS